MQYSYNFFKEYENQFSKEYVYLVEVNKDDIPLRATSPISLSQRSNKRKVQYSDCDNFTFVVPNTLISVGPSNSMQHIHHYVEHLPSKINDFYVFI